MNVYSKEVVEMTVAKFVKSFVLGISICALSAGVALADTGGTARPAYPGSGSEVEIQPAEIEPAAVSPEIIEKQREIDTYLFKEHRNEIERMGFTVVYTASTLDGVEIGITPFKQEYADYLYSLFGQDRIRVVEGQQAVPYVPEPIPPDQAAARDIMVDPDTPVSATAVDLPGVVDDSVALETGTQNSEKTAKAEALVNVTAQEDSQSASSISPLIYGAVAVVVIGGVSLAVRKLKMSQR